MERIRRSTSKEVSERGVNLGTPMRDYLEARVRHRTCPFGP